MTPLRVLTAAVLVSLAIAALGLAIEMVTFGPTATATAAHLEREVRQIVADRSATVERLAGRIADERAFVAEAARDSERVPELFDRLKALTAPADGHGTVATIYIPAPRSTAYTPLAWSQGPGEKGPPPSRLAGPPAVFVAPGYGGMRLVFVQPLVVEGTRIGSVVTETVLAPVNRSSTSVERRIETSIGPATVLEPYVTSRDEGAITNGFVIKGRDDRPLLAVTFEPSDLADRRILLRRHAAAAVLIPLVVATALLIPMTLRRRLQTASGSEWWMRTWRASGLLVLTVVLLLLAASLYDAPRGSRPIIAAIGLFGVAVVLPGAWWWRPRRRRSAESAIVRYLGEQLLAGCILALAIESGAHLLSRWISPETLDRWQFVLFPFDAGAALALLTLLILELALAWATVSVMATLAGRWAHRPLLTTLPVAVLLWTTPAVALIGWSGSAAHSTALGASLTAAAAVTFALGAGLFRRYYRRTTQSMRLLLGLVAIAAPVVAFYPLGAMTADRSTRLLIERDYAPATAGHPRQLLTELERAEEDIDRLRLMDLVSAPCPTDPQAPSSLDTQVAFSVWNRSSLARTRVISDVELYRADGCLVSRFAFNLPEFINRNTEQWVASNCSKDWDVYGEAAPFGAESRQMLHAMRGVCNLEGELQGGIVVHVASKDYQALPFVASANPYNALIEGLDVPDVHPLPDLQLAVYGWSYKPTFTSGQVGWVVPRSLFERLYRTGAPFWTTLDADGRTYHVHFSQNRQGVYALGYPRPTAFDHATRLAEIFALSAILFVLIQVAAMISTPLTRHRPAPLGQLFHEVRTSFYRKLFLFFVAAAVVPVLLFAVAFGSYMKARFRADVESEAKTTVAVARRVFEELAAADRRVDTPVAPPTDDVMVWIRQVIGQDVNLFEGTELKATSQRDLFDSELLPTRTPADVYRSILLERRAMAVVEDRVGDFEYLVAATPIPARGREAILTVPLAPRQREIERETDELNRGVLVGSVLVVLLAAGVGASLASRIADPVGRLTRATRQIAAGNLEVRVATDTADELRRLVDDFNSMAETLVAQRSALARTNQLKAWNEMARQVAHEIKNPLTPIQLAAEHLQHVHEDRGRPLGGVMDQCLRTILGQVRLLRRIASEFSNFSGEPRARPEALDIGRLVTEIVDPYRAGMADRITFEVDIAAALPRVWADRTLLARALTNLVENAIQAMPTGGAVRVSGRVDAGMLLLAVADTGVGMDEDALTRAFEPFFSTKTGGSGLGLANAKRNIEIGGGGIAIQSQLGAGTTVTVSLPLASPGPNENEA